MRLVVRNKSVQWALRWVQRILVAAAIVLLGYTGFVMVDAWIFEKQESAALERFTPAQPAKEAA